MEMHGLKVQHTVHMTQLDNTKISRRSLKEHIKKFYFMLSKKKKERLCKLLWSTTLLKLIFAWLKLNMKSEKFSGKAGFIYACVVKWVVN